MEVGYQGCGALHVALDRDEAEELRRRHRLLTDSEVEAEWLRPSECRWLEPGLAPSVAGGLRVDGEAGIDPRLVCSALAVAIRAEGGVIETGAEVVSGSFPEGGTPSLETADGRRFAGERVLLANGCWSGSSDWVPAAARPPVRPVKGQILTLAVPAGEPLCERLVVTERAYVVPRDGRAIVGATVEERGEDTAVTAGGILELLRESYR